jgi:hypothetical protein
MPFRDLEECQQISKIISRLSTPGVLHPECCEILICSSPKSLIFTLVVLEKFKNLQKKNKKNP